MIFLRIFIIQYEEGKAYCCELIHGLRQNTAVVLTANNNFVLDII